MNRLKIILILFCFLSTIGYSQPHLEEMTFELRFGILKGGEATFTTRDTLIENRNELHARLHGYTTGFAQLLYSVDDCFESVVDRIDFIPQQSSKVLKEQNYRFNNKVIYKHEQKKAHSNRSGWQFIDSGVCDISSLMCHLRYTDKLDKIQINEVIEIPFWDTDEWYPLKLKFTGIETIKTRYGTFECLRLEPQEIAGRFFNKKNPMNVWLTNDAQKLPILMEFNFSIGSVKCELIES